MSTPLDGRNAIIYGGGGSIGGAVARAMARDGARVFLTGRTRGPRVSPPVPRPPASRMNRCPR